MFKEKMELRLRMAVLPFIDFCFSRKDHISEIGACETTADYRKYFQNTLLPAILPVLHHNNRINDLAEVELLAERTYPYQEIRQVTQQGTRPDLFLLERLKQLSSLFLTHRNGKIALKYWGTLDYLKKRDTLFEAYKDVHKVALWNSLNRICCVEPVVMMYLLSNNMEDVTYLNAYYSYVHVPDIQLDQVLDKGVSETHLHLSAGGHFYMNWQKMMSPRRSDVSELASSDKKKPFEAMLSRSQDLPCYQIAAASVRLLLASYLKAHDTRGSKEFIQWLEEAFGDKVESSNAPASISYLLRTFQGVIPFEDKRNTIHSLYEVHEQIKERLHITLPEKDDEHFDLQESSSRDLIGQVFKGNVPETPVENVFLFKALQYMRKCDDKLFSRLFWQYLRVKNQLFECAVQGNLIKGLVYFKKYFDEATDLEIVDNQTEKWTFLLQHQLKNSQLKKIEVRIAPGSGNNIGKCKKNLAKKLRSFFFAYRHVLEQRQSKSNDDQAPLAGVIVHFIKKPDNKAVEKCYLNYRVEDGNNDSLHYKKEQSGYMLEMKAIRELREEIVGLADYIVGIDAASLESFTEPWVFAPVFRNARNSDSHQLVYRESPHRPIRNLGLTYHVGEDFRHMLSGLRQIDEVIDHFQFRAGDRIGHGMVLGVSPIHWAARNRIVIMPRIEYLENLLWIWGLWKEGIRMANFDSAHLEQTILSVANEIYAPYYDNGSLSAQGLTVFMLWNAYRLKFRDEIGNSSVSSTDEESSQWDCEQKNKKIVWTERAIANAAHCKCFLLSMKHPIEVEVTKEVEEWITFIQKVMMEKVSRLGIVIETNPTSNTAIGEIEHIFDHYIHQLNGRSLYDSSYKETSAMVTINTDDPIVFNTNISNEFAYIFYSMQEKGAPREEILQWIDRVRETGMNSSFIQSRSLRCSDAIQEVVKIINKLDDYLKRG